MFKSNIAQLKSDVEALRDQYKKDRERECLEKEIEDEGKYKIRHAIVNDLPVFVLSKTIVWYTGYTYTKHTIEVGKFKTMAEARKAHKHIIKEDIKL